MHGQASILRGEAGFTAPFLFRLCSREHKVQMKSIDKYFDIESQNHSVTNS